MRTAGVAALVAAGAIFVQMILGGTMLLERTVILAHAAVGGIIILGIAPVETIVFWRVKPPSKFLRRGGILLIILTFVQGGLGGSFYSYDSLDSFLHSIPLAAHGMNAALIFAVSIVLLVVAVREVRRVEVRPQQG